MKNKMLMSVLACTLVLGLTMPNTIRANEVAEEQIKEFEVSELPETPKVEVLAATNPADAPVDWAFDESSVELNDAIIEAYPALDVNGDGFISKTEASALVSHLIVNNKGISGTMEGIQYFTGVYNINLSNNNLTGNIPTEINNLSGNLTNLYLFGNKLSGEVPNELYSLTNLVDLNVGYNAELAGNVSDLSQLTNIKQLYISETSFSGELSSGVYNLTHLEKLGLLNLRNVSGNPSLGFASSTTINYLDIRGTSLIQASPEIPTLGYTVGTFLYDNLADELLIDSKTNLAEGVTQETIDKAQESTDFITDPAEKQQWQDDIDLAQKMLDARNKVDGLLTTPDLANLKDGVDKAAIDDAQDLVTALPNGDLKDDLQAKIDIANNLLDAKNKTEGLLNPDGSLGAGVDQNKIDEAQDAVNKVPDGITKEELQKIINEAQKQLDEKNFIVLNGFPIFKGNGSVAAKISAPVQQFVKAYVNGTELNTSDYMIANGSTIITLNETYLKTLANGTYTVEVEFTSGAKVATTLIVDVTSKPSLKPTIDEASVTKKSSVNTGDQTNISALSTLLIISFASLVVAMKLNAINHIFC